MALFSKKKEEAPVEEAEAIEEEMPKEKGDDISTLAREIAEIKQMLIKAEDERSAMAEELNKLFEAEEAEAEMPEKEREEEDTKKPAEAPVNEEPPGDEEGAEKMEEEMSEEEAGDALLNQMLEEEPEFEKALNEEGAREKLNALDEEEQANIEKLLKENPKEAAKVLMQILRQKPEEEEEMPGTSFQMNEDNNLSDERRAELLKEFGY